MEKSKIPRVDLTHCPKLDFGNWLEYQKEFLNIIRVFGDDALSELKTGQRPVFVYPTQDQLIYNPTDDERRTRQYRIYTPPPPTSVQTPQSSSAARALAVDDGDDDDDVTRQQHPPTLSTAVEPTVVYPAGNMQPVRRFAADEDGKRQCKTEYDRMEKRENKYLEGRSELFLLMITHAERRFIDR